MDYGDVVIDKKTGTSIFVYGETPQIGQFVSSKQYYGALYYPENYDKEIVYFNAEEVTLDLENSGEKGCYAEPIFIQGASIGQTMRGSFGEGQIIGISPILPPYNLTFKYLVETNAKNIVTVTESETDRTQNG